MTIDAFARHGVALAAILCCLPLSAQTIPPPDPQPENLAPDPAAAESNSTEQPVRKPGTRPSPAPAAKETTKEPSAASLGRVEITGTVSDTDQRRASTAAKIIIGKDEIERFGDSSVSEILKRLPGVTTGGRPGRGGDVRMRGMGGGYTQLLVNGERMPPGFSLDNLPPEQVERIEVLRAPTAEYGARAVAGTINIVLKEALKKTLNEFRGGLALEENRVSPGGAWTRNDKFGDNVSYTLTLSANRTDNRDENDARTQWFDRNTGATLLDQHETGYSANQRDGINLNGRIQIALRQGESLLLTPFVVISQNSTHGQSQLDQASGGIIPAPYASYTSQGDGRFSQIRTNTQWQKNLGDGTRLEVRYGVGNGTFETRSARDEFNFAGQPTRTTHDDSSTRERSWSLTGKASQQLETEHSLVGGVEFDSNSRRQSRTTLQNGTPILTEFGDDLKASSLRVATYVQDEWNPTKQIAAYAGLRWEGIESRSDSEIYQVLNRSSVLTPLLHATWQPDEKSRNQFRTSLTRSYKAATLQELIARPSISQRFPNGTNEVGSPDRAGNPDLQPELARGFEIAYEHYLDKGGLISANLFYRHINDLIRNVVALEDVSWSTDRRWVSRPQNVGNAVAQGLELEAKFRMDEIWPDALPIALRTNVSFFDSSVEKVPGPNNRLEGQPKGTANLGADYKMRGLPLSFGGSINVTPGFDLQLSDIQRNFVGTKVVADAFLVWFINTNAQLRVSANNFLPRDYLSSRSVLDNTQRQEVENSNPSKIRWGFRLELKL